MRGRDTEPMKNVLEGIDDEEKNWDFERIVTAEILALSGLCGKLQKLQRFCENGMKLCL